MRRISGAVFGPCLLASFSGCIVEQRSYDHPREREEYREHEREQREFDEHGGEHRDLDRRDFEEHRY